MQPRVAMSLLLRQVRPAGRSSTPGAGSSLCHLTLIGKEHKNPPDLDALVDGTSNGDTNDPPLEPEEEAADYRPINSPVLFSDPAAPSVISLGVGARKLLEPRVRGRAVTAIIAPAQLRQRRPELLGRLVVPPPDLRVELRALLLPLLGEEAENQQPTLLDALIQGRGLGAISAYYVMFTVRETPPDLVRQRVVRPGNHRLDLRLVPSREDLLAQPQPSLLHDPLAASSSTSRAAPGTYGIAVSSV